MKLVRPAPQLSVLAVRSYLMPSSVIRRFDYDAQDRQLLITFTTGRRYLYSDVPEEAVRQFRAAFSKGSHFNRHIRDRYACQEMAQLD